MVTPGTQHAWLVRLRWMALASFSVNQQIINKVRTDGRFIFPVTDSWDKREGSVNNVRGNFAQVTNNAPIAVQEKALRIDLHQRIFDIFRQRGIDVIIR